MLFTVSQGYCFRIIRQNMCWISFHRQATRSLWALLLTACRAIKTRNEPHAAQFTPLWAVQMPGATLSCQPVGCLYRYLSHTHTHTSSLSSLPPLESDMCTNSPMLQDLQSTPTRHVDCDLKGRNQICVEQVSMQRHIFQHIYIHITAYSLKKIWIFFVFIKTKSELDGLLLLCLTLCLHQQKPIYKPNRSWQSAGHSPITKRHRRGCWRRESPQ